MKKISEADPLCNIAKEKLTGLQESLHRGSTEAPLSETNEEDFQFNTADVPWTSEELLGKPIKDFLAVLAGGETVAKLLLESRMSFVANRNLKKSLEIGKAMKTSGVWYTGAWSELISAWCILEIGEDDWNTVLDLVQTEELFLCHSKSVARTVLRTLHGIYGQDMQTKANSIAVSLWNVLNQRTRPSSASIQSTSQIPNESNTWNRMAEVDAVGELVQFWLTGILMHEEQTAVRTCSCEETWHLLESLIVADTWSGNIARSALASRFAELAHINEDWTRSHLVPLFGKSESVTDFQPVWDGFLLGSSGGVKIDATVTKLLQDVFPAAIRQAKAIVCRSDARCICSLLRGHVR